MVEIAGCCCTATKKMTQNCLACCQPKSGYLSDGSYVHLFYQSGDVKYIFCPKKVYQIHAAALTNPRTPFVDLAITESCKAAVCTILKRFIGPTEKGYWAATQWVSGGSAINHLNKVQRVHTFPGLLVLWESTFTVLPESCPSTRQRGRLEKWSERSSLLFMRLKWWDAQKRIRDTYVWSRDLWFF